MVLLIDNYDSFSYNLFQYVGELNPDIKVIRNDVCNCAEIEEMNPSHIIVSPGPGRPSDAGVCEEVIEYFKGKVPILGVCLGHQAICEVFGATITYAKELMHGKQSVTTVDINCPIFQDIQDKIKVARYHSLAADPDTIPNCLKIVAKTADGEIMAVQHKNYEIYGLQFHPESIMTKEGKKMLENFFKL
ncbi:MAG: aminodeoxychorismate/anthranilate synthase component II [Lachnospiraceae bacterium]|nr:aminodeoxychorismate/anthranilate synthase component II [Lachnospiraceae bacterium]